MEGRSSRLEEENLKLRKAKSKGEETVKDTLQQRTD